MISQEYREFRKVIRQWAEREVAPFAADVDRNERFPEEAWRSYVSNGWVALQFPSDHGGTGADNVTCAILIEEMARVCASSSLMALVSKLGMIPLIGWGSAELKAKYLPEMASGRSQASFCLSEPEAGSDVVAMGTTARRDGDSYVLNGEKCWVTNAGMSDVYTVFAKTDPNAGSRTVSCFVVERSWGIEFGAPEHLLGVRGSPTANVILNDVRVPAENLVGSEGMGLQIALGTLDRARPTVGAQAVGIASGAIDFAARYLQERHQFGHPIAEFQGLRFMLANMAMKTEAARRLVYGAMDLLDAGDPDDELSWMAAMAKCFASDVAMEVTTDAVQLLGGYGYSTDLPVERYMRDAKITQIYEGTNQILRVVIAKHLLG